MTLHRSIPSLLLAACAALVLAMPASAQDLASLDKAQLIERLLQAQRPAIESLARQMVERPAGMLLQRAGQFVAVRVPADQREAVGKDVKQAAESYFEQTYPYVRERALKIAPQTVGKALADNLSEAELREILTVLESPTWVKFQRMAPQLTMALGRELAQEVGNQIDERARELGRTIAARVEPAAAKASAPAGGR